MATTDRDVYMVAAETLKVRFAKLKRETDAAHARWRDTEDAEGTLDAWTKAVDRENRTDTAIIILEEIIQELKA